MLEYQTEFEVESCFNSEQEVQRIIPLKSSKSYIYDKSYLHESYVIKSLCNSVWSNK